MCIRVEEDAYVYNIHHGSDGVESAEVRFPASTILPLPSPYIIFRLYDCRVAQRALK